MFCVGLVCVLFEGGIEMADGMGPGRVTLSGVVLAGLLLVLIIASLYLFIAQPFWFPTLASEHGGRIDSLFGTVLVVTGIAFVLVQGALDYLSPDTVPTVTSEPPTGTTIQRSRRLC